MNTVKNYSIAFSAGETSGDQHAANMFLELKKHQPGISAYGMGGMRMKKVGIEINVDSSNIGVIGVVEVLKHYSEIRRALKEMKKILTENKPDLLVCIDYKEFNFKLAKFAKSIGIKVLFYVSPQIWAWRPGRVKKYGEVIDAMAVIFPFEVPYYEAENIPVRYVGHPSIDKVRPKHTKEESLQLFGIGAASHVIGILPGSRNNEIERMLPVMLESAHKLQSKFAQAHFLLAQADNIEDRMINKYLKQARLNITVIKDQPYDVIQCCDAIMTTSGTATLEIALLETPMVITYKLSPLTYWLGRLLVKIPFIGLPNIVLGKSVVKEFIQSEANADKIVAEISKILKDEEYEEDMRKNLHQVRQRLGTGEGSKNTALLALEMLDGGSKTA